MRSSLTFPLAAALCLAALLCAPAAWAARVNPDGTIAPAGNPDQAQAATAAAAKSAATEQAKSIIPDPLAVIKKAAEAQGDISPYTVKALQHDPKAMEAIGRAPASNNSGGNSGGATPKSTKAMYGDIIIHK